MSEHTNGPWEVGSHQRIITTGWPITTNDGTAVAYVLGERNPELQQNARLIAAAPDLLEALIFMRYRFMDTEGSYGTWEEEAIDAADAAITKATKGVK